MCPRHFTLLLYFLLLLKNVNSVMTDKRSFSLTLDTEVWEVNCSTDREGAKR